MTDVRVQNIFTAIPEISDNVICRLEQEATLCVFSAFAFDYGSRGKLPVFNVIFDILRKITSPYKATCAGGVVEWLCGNTNVFGDIDIFISKATTPAETQLFLSEVFPALTAYTSAGTAYAPGKKDITVLGCMQKRNLLLWRPVINVQFIQHRYASINALLENFDLPDACGSAITLENDRIVLHRFCGQSTFKLLQENPCRMVKHHGIPSHQTPVRFTRFRKYCMRLGCFCLLDYKHDAPAAVIRQCRLFTHRRTEAEPIDVRLYWLFAVRVLMKPFSYQEFCDTFCR